MAGPVGEGNGRGGTRPRGGGLVDPAVRSTLSGRVSLLQPGLDTQRGP